MLAMNEQKLEKTKEKKEIKHPAKRRKMIESEINRLTEELASEVKDSWKIDNSELIEENENLLLSQQLLGQFQNPNKAFFDKLEQLTVKNGSFILKRLNFGIQTNTQYDFAVPVRRYASILTDEYHFKKGSFWSALSSKDKTFSGKRKITREEAIAFAFAYRLSSEQLNALLESLAYARLYPRQLMDAALIFTLDTYLCSQEYEDFANRYGPLKPKVFVANYVFFEKIFEKETAVDLTLMQSPFMVSLKKQFSNDTKNLYNNGEEDNWYISRNELRKIILEDIGCDVNLTAESRKELYKRIEEVKESRKELYKRIEEVKEAGQFGNITWFKLFLNSASLKGTDNRQMFVQNSEKSLLYLLKMMYRYLQTETIRSVKRGAKKPDGIRLSLFFTRFSEFLDGLNLINPADLFVREYACIVEEENKQPRLSFSSIDFCNDFFGVEYEELPEALQIKYDNLLKLHYKYALDLKIDNDDYSDILNDKVAFDKKEERKIIKILKSGDKRLVVPANRSTNYKKLFSGADISRLMFILVYLFTFVSKSNETFTLGDGIPVGTVNTLQNKKNSVYYSERGSFDELNYWLFDAGFPKLSDTEPLTSFVCDFMNHDFYEDRQIDSKVTVSEDSNLLNKVDNTEKTTYEKNKAKYVFNVFRYVILHDKSLDMLSKLHLSSYSLFTAGTELLPENTVGEKND